jgi:methane/ammonia monooxygenase subunit B
MRKLLKRLLAVPAVAVVVALAMPAAPASAHGEAAQEAFLRMGTVAFYDVKFSTTEVEQGQEVKLTGTAKILDTWPEQLAEPKLGFISVVAPGPVVVIRERTINGAPAPHAIEVEKGGVYNFEMTLAGRRPGKWHIHPILGIHGAGSLLGPGQYVNVKESTSGFTEPVKLTSGSTIDLETVGNGSLTFWAIAWAVVGMVWLLYWIVPKPTVTRLPVTSQIPLNTDGMEYGLITKRDHKMMNIIVAVTLALLAAGWIYQSQAYPGKMPQQVLRFAPPAAAAAAEFVTAEITGAEFNPATETVTLNVDVHNTGDKPATLQAFTTSTLTFATAGVGTPVHGREAIVSPQATVAPGAKANLTVTMSDEVWEHERLMPLNESRMQITGLLRFKDSANVENFVTVQSFVRPVRAV